MDMSQSHLTNLTLKLINNSVIKMSIRMASNSPRYSNSKFILRCGTLSEVDLFLQICSSFWAWYCKCFSSINFSSLSRVQHGKKENLVDPEYGCLLGKPTVRGGGWWAYRTNESPMEGGEVHWGLFFAAKISVNSMYTYEEPNVVGVGKFWLPWPLVMRPVVQIGYRHRL